MTIKTLVATLAAVGALLAAPMSRAEDWLRLRREINRNPRLSIEVAMDTS
jgi:hypothetical protein